LIDSPGTAPYNHKMTSGPMTDLFELGEAEIVELLAPAHFSDWRAASQRLQRMAARHPQAQPVLAAIFPHLLVQLGSAAGPDGVLISLERLANNVSDPLRFYTLLAENPHAIDALVILFSSSQYLTEILLRNPEYGEALTCEMRQAQIKTAGQYAQESRGMLAGMQDYSEKLDALRVYQHRELLRIGVCDLIDQFDLAAVTGQLSNLADGLVRTCLEIAAEESSLNDGIGMPSGFSVIGMGKLGGQELNYSSDIDLLFISNRDRPEYRRLGQKLIDALAHVSGEGFLYRVDMRLRPWGRDGALVTTQEGYLSYLRKSARLWEKQALLKARWISGDEKLGAEFLSRIAGHLFSSSAEEARQAVFAMKQRTESHLRQQGRAWGEVKLGEGSIRDIEFVVQYLQLAFGGRQPEIRSRNTLEAIRRLTRFGLLSLDASHELSTGYVFLRTVEHHLQMLNYRQTYTLPSDPAALVNLARRLGFQGESGGEHFLERYKQHSAAIRSIYMWYLGGHMMDKSDQPANTPEIQRHVERMDPSYQTAFSPQDISHHAALAGQLDEDHLAQVDATALEDNRWRVTIVGFDYPGVLSLICGLMFVYGLNIHDGNAFTYEPANEPSRSRENRSTRRKIVDVFTVTPGLVVIDEAFWLKYSSDLADLLRLMQSGQRQEAQVELAKRAAEILRGMKSESSPLYPIDIEINNDISRDYSVLRIAALDTTGFLYELTNALVFSRIYIARVEIETIGQKVRDTLYVTDSEGRKIISAQKQRELRAATVLTKHFTHLLPLSSDPQSALLHFHAFIGQLFRRSDWPDEFVSLERPEVLGALAQLLGVSDFLWDDFLRMQHANLFPVVRDVDALETAKSRTYLQAELEATLLPVHPGPLAPTEDAPWREALNAFKDREMFRIDMRHILGHSQEFWQFSEELTDLAEVIVNSAFHLSMEDLRSVYGAPSLENGSPAEMSVCALGKCGGRELGFASDIELMFIYSGNGKTDGPKVITTSEFYEKVVENFVSAVQARREGIFEVDLQLRPYGKAGSLAVSLESFRKYFSPEGPAWPYERQALVRLRPVAGDRQLGQMIVALRDAFVYTPGIFDVTAMRAMRERHLRHLVKGGTFNPKYSPGGLVDIEYLIQGLQIIHGQSLPDLRTTNTRDAMSALYRHGILSPDDYTQLRKAYTFLRWLIDSLRMVAGNAKDLIVPLETSEEFAYLARRLRYGNDRARLKEELQRYTAFVQEINQRLLSR